MKINFLKAPGVTEQAANINIGTAGSEHIDYNCSSLCISSTQGKVSDKSRKCIYDRPGFLRNFCRKRVQRTETVRKRPINSTSKHASLFRAAIKSEKWWDKSNSTQKSNFPAVSLKSFFPAPKRASPANRSMPCNEWSLLSLDSMKKINGDRYYQQFLLPGNCKRNINQHHTNRKLFVI